MHAVLDRQPSRRADGKWYERLGLSHLNGPDRQRWHSAPAL